MVEKWSHYGGRTIKKNNAEYLLSPTPPERLLHQIVNGLNVLDLIETGPASESEFTAVDLKIMKFGIMKVLQSNSSHPIALDTMKLIQFCEKLMNDKG